MDDNKLAAIRAEIAAARRRSANLKHSDLAKIARMLGRERSSKRTNEPTYESALLDTNVITIPDHSKGVKKGTALNILKQFDQDVLKFAAKLAGETKDVIDLGDDYEN